MLRGFGFLPLLLAHFSELDDGLADMLASIAEFVSQVLDLDCYELSTVSCALIPPRVEDCSDQ